MKAIVQAAITLGIVALISVVVRLMTGDVGYVETMVNLLLVVVVQDILFGKRR